MFLHHLRLITRFVRRTKLYFLINIFGLAFGIGCSLLLYQYISFHLGFDQFNTHADRIYRVTCDTQFGEEELFEATSMPPLAPALEADFAEVEATVRLFDPNLFDQSIFVTYNDKTFKEDNILYADSTFFKVFSYQLLKGSPATALSKPNSVVLTENSRLKYFGNDPAVGMTLLINNEAFVVTGICANPPQNSHFSFDFLTSLNSLKRPRFDIWLNTPFYTYVLLKKGHNANELQSKLPVFAKRHVGPDLEKYYNTSFDQFQKGEGKFEFNLQPLAGIHLHSNLGGELGSNEDISRIQILGGVGLLILIIAAINFVNLTTALSSQRAKEIGVKKVFGGQKAQLVFQFLFETFLNIGVAVVLAVAFAYAVQPLFNDVMNQNLDLKSLVSLPAGFALLGFMILLTVVAGIYPAFYMSKFRPANVLKGHLNLGFKNSGLRNTLVVFQFSISIFLIACSILFYQQMRFMMSKDLGFDSDRVIVIRNVNKLKDIQVLKNELLSLPGIVATSVSTVVPSSDYQTLLAKPEGSEQTRSFAYFYADEDYMKTLGLTLIDGRNFSPDFPADSSGAVLVNKSLLRELEMENPFGKSILSQKSMPIVGVIKDYNFESLRSKIQPMAIFYQKKGEFLSVKFTSANISETVDKLNQAWSRVAGNLPFEFDFLDDRLAQQYRQEESFNKMVILFTGISIVVSVLGLVGLITFAIKNREKEISIRKVLGSSVGAIQLLFSKDILKLVLVSSLVAVPASYLMILDWLRQFSYKTVISPLVFVMAIAVMLLITFSTVLYFTIKAALINPVRALRNE